MNAVTPLHKSGYGINAVRTARDAEYDIFSRVTRMLREADTRAEQIAATYKNNELWTLLASDLANPENALPDELKANLISLAIFSIRHGSSVMQGEALVQPLIDINMSMMKGLRGSVDT